MSFKAYGQGGPLENKEKISLQIQKILKTHSRMAKNMGLVVFDLHSGRYDLTHNENKKFIPASLSKIITAGAVMHFLKPYHQFETFFLSQTPVDQQGVLKGHLYLKGGGDPGFVSENLWILVNHLRRSGLKKVKGNLIVDDYLFGKAQQHRSWLKSDRSYSAPVSSLSFNWNSVTVYVQPSRIKGGLAQVFIDPKNTYIKTINKARTQGRKKNTIKVKRRPHSPGDIIEVRGFIPLDSKEMVIYKNVTKPAFWTGWNAIEFLKQRGITVEGQVVKGQTPSSSYILSSHKGSFVFRLVQDMMKFSSNFLADMLTIHLALFQNHKKDLWNQGLKQIHKYMEKKGLIDYSFSNPSGLSRKNKLLPKDLLKFLIHDYSSVYSFEKLSSYPVPNSPGTLQKRFQNLENSIPSQTQNTPHISSAQASARTIIRAKTGWLSGVVGLAGYIQTQKGKTKAFVFIYNGSTKKQMKAQEFFDQLASLLALD